MKYNDIEINVDKRFIKETENSNDFRSPYLHDRDRILFSRSFRRLAGKTQVVPVSGKVTSDHLRSRLTHSLEVMQIASSIGNDLSKDSKFENNLQKKPDRDLIEAIALGHDIGHTPYGHVGERALCGFFKKDISSIGFPEEKLKHSFQSLKICCFLEKQYYPDYYGLNLTMATLDGVFKHSKIEEKERQFYRKCFKSYFPVFTEKIGYENINVATYDIMNELFEYYSPITLEGAIVSIADEIAQCSHDIEDLRRLTNFNEMLPFYEKVDSFVFSDSVNNTIEKYNLCDVRKDFSKALEKAKGNTSNEIKLERMYTKLILKLSIPLIGSFMRVLWSIDENDRLNYLKNNYTGSFKELIKFSEKLSVNSEIQEGLVCLDKIFSSYNEIPSTIKEIARWDIKGKEMCENLMEILYDSLNQTDDGNLNIFDNKLREHLRKSYQAGSRFATEMGHEKTNEIAKKCLIWDYVAGMTDAFIIKEYESLSFKKIELH